MPKLYTNTIEIADIAKVQRQGEYYLSVNKDSRDALVAASAFLVAYKYGMNRDAFEVMKIINHISNMLYGFEESE